MITELISIVLKAKGKEDEDLGSHEYSYPETLEEAIETDGEADVYKHYAYARKNKWREDKKRALKPPKAPAWLKKAMEDPTKKAAILKQLGITMDEV